MREGGEDQLRVGERRRIGGLEGDAPAERQCERFALLGVRGRKGEVEVWMRGDEGAELAPGVPRGPEDPDWKFMHDLIIFMLCGVVKSGHGQELPRPASWPPGVAAE